MIHGYPTNAPYLNNYDEAMRVWATNKSTPMPQKAKSIMVTPPTLPLDEEGNPLIPQDSLPTYDFAPEQAVYHNIYYQTTNIPHFFGRWNLEDFNHHYTNQQKLCYETLNLLRITKNSYSQTAIQSTENQYRDLFFAYGFAFPVAQVLQFLKSQEPDPTPLPELEAALNESRNDAGVSEASVASPTPPGPELFEGPAPLFLPNPSLTTTKDITDQLAEELDVSLEDTIDNNIVGVSVEELIKQSKYTFRPIIRGSPVYLKWQEDIIYDQSKIIVVLGSRQIGKSYVMALRAYLSSYKGYRRDIMVCAYITETTDHIKKYFERLIENLPEEAWKHNAQKNYWENTITKSRVIFRSLSEDGHRIRGNTLHEVIIDECLLIDNDSFESVIRPTVSVTGGVICMISTPGEKNWFFDEVQAAKQRVPGYSYYEITADNNPLLDPTHKKYIESKKDSPVIQREYYCKFIEGAGTVFRPVKTSDISVLANQDLLNKSWFLMAYDPARKGKDHAGFAAAYIHDGHIKFFQANFIPDQYKDEWKTQIPYLKKLRDKYPYLFIMDSTTVGDAVVTLVKQTMEVDCAITYTGGDGATQDMNWPYGTTKAWNVGKSEMINIAMNYIDEGIAQFFPYTCQAFFQEVEGLILGRTSLGHSSFKTKGFDDVTNAVMQIIWYVHKHNLLSKPVPPRAEIKLTETKAYRPVQRPQDAKRTHNSLW